MNSEPARSGYALTRLRAHYAQLVSPAEWQRLDRALQFAAFLQQARDTSLQPWIAPFDPGIDPHQIEATLRESWLRRAGEVAAWLPAAERPAAAALGRLALLPVFRHRAGGGESYAWLPPRQVEEEQNPVVDGAAMLQQWLARWQAAWPASLDRAGRVTLERWRDDALAPWRERFGKGWPPGEMPAAGLELELRRGFRRQHSPLVCACAYLGLLWLELVRLRGALLKRRLFAPPDERAT